MSLLVLPASSPGVSGWTAIATIAAVIAAGAALVPAGSSSGSAAPSWRASCMTEHDPDVRRTPRRIPPHSPATSHHVHNPQGTESPAQSAFSYLPGSSRHEAAEQTAEVSPIPNPERYTSLRPDECSLWAQA